MLGQSSRGKRQSQNGQASRVERMSAQARSRQDYMTGGAIQSESSLPSEGEYVQLAFSRACTHFST
eukprot:11725401-Heterocapsa_arctica.AAC.1